MDPAILVLYIVNTAGGSQVPRGRTNRGLNIRAFALRSVGAHPRDLVDVVARTFEISRQAAGRYIAELVTEGKLTAQGTRNRRTYSLPTVSTRVHLLLPGLEEHLVWQEHIEPVLQGLPRNVSDVWQYGCTEMVNNAIDHSDGRNLIVSIDRNPLSTRIVIIDDGTGIFRKIKEASGLDDDRQAILELVKGKFTTDPERHTGEGIFFTSRVVDDFAILSRGVAYMHEPAENEDWVLERETSEAGTSILMQLDNSSTRTTQEIFDQFASAADDYGFNKTVVPVRLVKEGSELVVSRSQAKRLMARLDRFKTIILDFDGVDDIGRAFADEIFRVFERSHPEVLIIPIRATDRVEQMIKGARNTE